MHGPTCRRRGVEKRGLAAARGQQKSASVASRVGGQAENGPVGQHSQREKVSAGQNGGREGEGGGEGKQSGGAITSRGGQRTRRRRGSDHTTACTTAMAGCRDKGRAGGVGHTEGHGWGALPGLGQLLGGSSTAVLARRPAALTLAGTRSTLHAWPIVHAAQALRRAAC